MVAWGPPNSSDMVVMSIGFLPTACVYRKQSMTAEHDGCLTERIYLA